MRFGLAVLLLLDACSGPEKAPEPKPEATAEPVASPRDPITYLSCRGEGANKDLRIALDEANGSFEISADGWPSSRGLAQFGPEQVQLFAVRASGEPERLPALIIDRKTLELSDARGPLTGVCRLTEAPERKF